MTDALITLSDALAARVRHAAPMVVGLEWGTRDLRSAILWADGVAVTSEQSLPETETYHAILPGGARVRAVPVGRDPTTNVAVLRLDAGTGVHEAGSELDVGGMVVALGSDGEGAARARLGIVERLGPAWQSQCGGRIDRMIRLDMSLPSQAEGGPVIDARGRLVGMSTFGPRREVLVIPGSTIERAVAQLLAHGHIRRGWLGVGVQPVLLPRDIEDAAEANGGSGLTASGGSGQTASGGGGQTASGGSGLMVLSIAEGAPIAGVLLPGDILLAAGPVRLSSPRALTSLLGPEAIGSVLALRVLRGGGVVEASVTVAARPA